MGFPMHFDRLSYDASLSRRFFSIFTNSANPDEMLHNVCRYPESIGLTAYWAIKSQIHKYLEVF